MLKKESSPRNYFGELFKAVYLYFVGFGYDRWDSFDHTVSQAVNVFVASSERDAVDQYAENVDNEIDSIDGICVFGDGKTDKYRDGQDSEHNKRYA